MMTRTTACIPASHTASCQRPSLGGYLAFGGLGMRRWPAHTPSVERVNDPNAVGGRAVAP